MNKKRIQPLFIAGLLGGLILVGLVGAKAFLSSLTHDESITYNQFVHQSFREIISYADPYPNNHILNTLLVKLSEYCFGNGELALRLPSIGAMILYLVFALLLARRLPLLIRIPAILLLLANPYLMDFFGLARGYALSIGFMTMSLHYGLEFLKKNSYRCLVWCNLGAMLAVCSNFSMINFYLALLISLYGFQVYRRLSGSTQLPAGNRMHLICLLFAGITTGIIYEPLRKITSLHQLDFGGKTGLIPDTVDSLVRASLYQVPAGPGMVLLICWIIVALFIGLLGYSLFHIIKDRSFPEQAPELMLVQGVLLGVLLASVLQHHLLGQNYFIGRFALFLYPLFLLNLLYVAGNRIRSHRQVPLTVLLTWTLAGLMLLHTCLSWNFRSYLDWDYDRNTRKVMELVSRHYQDHRTSRDSVRMGNTWWYEPSVNYYRKRYHMDWLRVSNRKGLEPADLYFYISVRDTEYLPPQRYQGQYQTLFSPENRDAFLIYNQP